jgi:hypothetical protein
MEFKVGDLVIVTSGKYSVTAPGSYGIIEHIDDHNRLVSIKFIKTIGETIDGRSQFTIRLDSISHMTKLQRYLSGVDNEL